MRILFVCPFLKHHGGLEEEVEATVRLALEARHDVVVLTPYEVRRDATVRLGLPEVVPFISAQGVWRRSLAGRALFLAARLRHAAVKRMKASAAEEAEFAKGRVPEAFFRMFWQKAGRQMLADSHVVHVFGRPRPFLVEAIVQAKAMDKIVIYEEISTVTPDYASRPAHHAFIAAANLCDVVIAKSERQAAAIRSCFGYHGRPVIIEQWAYGVEQALLTLESRQDRRADARVTLGSLGRLASGKGLDTLLAGFARAQKKVGDLRLRIAGRGPYEEGLRSLARQLDVGDFVEFAGHVEDQEKVDFYASIDAFLLTSQEESGPITGVEAMAAGLPIVSTPVGAMPERLEEETEALFFPVDGAEELCAAIVRVVGDSGLRNRLGMAARHRYMLCNHSGLCAARMLSVWAPGGQSERKE